MIVPYLKANLANLSYLVSNLQGCTCGIANVPKSKNRIVGGSESAENKYPWMVRVMTTGAIHGCGGTIISRQYVLTAAHCVVERENSGEGKIRPVSDFSVTLAEHDHSQNSADRVPVSEIIPYPKYMNNDCIVQCHYDIAVLKLSSPLTFSENIASVCLPAHTMGNHAGKDAVVTGWGVTESMEPSSVLKEAHQTILTNKHCNKMTGDDRFQKYTFRNFLTLFKIHFQYKYLR